MKTFAILNNKMVINTIVANTIEDAQFVSPNSEVIEYTSENPAQIGFVYDPDANVFYAPQPFPSWILNKTTHQWEAPIVYPNDGKIYEWDESTLSWVEITPTE